MAIEKKQTRFQQAKDDCRTGAILLGNWDQVTQIEKSRSWDDLAGFTTYSRRWCVVNRRLKSEL